MLGLHRWNSTEPDLEQAAGYRIVRVPRPRFVSAELGRELLAALSGHIAIRLRRWPLPVAAVLLLPLAAGEIAARLAWCVARVLAMLLPRVTLGALRHVRAASHMRRLVAAPGVAPARPPGWVARTRMLLATLRHVLCTADAFWRAAGSGPKEAVIYCNDLDTALAGLLLRRAFGGGVLIYDSHEYWPYSNVEALAIHVRLFRAFDRFFMRRADFVITVSDPLAREMERAYGVPPIRVVPNAEPWIERPAALPCLSEIDRLAAGRVRFIFQGNFAPRRGLEEVVDAWSDVDQGQAALFLRGFDNPCRAALAQRAEALGLLGRSVFILPPVEVEDLVAAAGEADVGIIPYSATLPAYRYACPNKLSQYLHGGLAILSNDIPYVAQQVELGQFGRLYDATDRASIVAAVNFLSGDRERLKQLKDNAQAYGRDRFNWQVLSAPLREILGEISAKQPQ
jgi:glycosyltransferase involved in cell wall biosynthesis